MLKKGKIRRTPKRILSLMLIMSVMFSLLVPFDISVSSAETPSQATGEAATDENIYAFLYYADPNNTSTTLNLELVFQSTNTPLPGRKPLTQRVNGVDVPVYFSDFAGTCHYSRGLYNNSNVPNINNQVRTKMPWDEKLWHIVSVDFKDEIAPTYIACWFYGLQNIREFKHLTNLKTYNCKDMSYAFNCSTGKSSGTPQVYDLDLSHFDTSNVEVIDNFIRLNSLQHLNLSGFDLSKVSYMTSFITNSDLLTDINLTGVDVSKVKFIANFITSCKALESVDLSSINPLSVYDLTYFLKDNTSLKHVTFAEGFSPGRDLPLEPTEAPEGYTGLTYTYNGKTCICGSGSARVRMGSMFYNCTSLEEIDFGNWDLHHVEAELHNSLFKRYYEMGSFFYNCKSLVSIKNIDHLFIDETTNSSWGCRYMFENCESLESIDLSNVTTIIGGPGIFKGCKSLRALDFSSFGQAFYKNDWYYYASLEFNEYDDNKKDYFNIYEGCEELSEVTLSPYYPPSNRTLTDNNNPMGYGTCVPPVERTWTKVAELDSDAFKTHPKKGDPTQTVKYQYPTKPGNKIVWIDLPTPVAVGTTLSTTELFTDFQPEYAGKWIALSKITFNSKGGTPALQSFDGARLSVLNIPEGELITPTKKGYKFVGWFYEDEEGVEHEFVNNTVAESWTYYAKWEPITYNIVLHSNETNDQTLSFNDVKYDEFVALHGNWFTPVEEGTILTGWNTLSSGSGRDFGSNESVDKLSDIDGATVDLYAMWRIPDAIVTFDSQGGSAVPSKDYTLIENETVPFGLLSEPLRDGYTFTGWYTDDGRKVLYYVPEEGTYDPNEVVFAVTQSCTLHAHWKKKPVITFNLNGGMIKESTDDYVKVVDYGLAIGSVPTPYYGNQTFEGWFTAKTGGTRIIDIEEVIAEQGATYYAHWGWKPQFQTNGGTFETEPQYAIQNGKDYNMGTLPVVSRPNYTFLGWFIGDTDLQVTDNQVVDLEANGSVFKAHWQQNPTAKVKLDPNGGSYTSGGQTVTTEQLYTTVYTGHKVLELPTPTMANANFLGWFDSPTGGNKYTYDSEINGDVTLYAHWETKDITVRFNPTDGEIVGENEYHIASGSTFTYLPGANWVEAVGSAYSIVKSFDGWYTQPNGGGEKLTTSTVIDGNVEYYANWVDNMVEKDTYTSMIRWGTLSDSDVTNAGDKLVFHPQSKGNVSAHLTVDFSLENNDGLPAGSVRITIPRKLFEGWDGSDQTSVNESFSKFTTVLSDDGKYMILTNKEEFKSTSLEPVYTVDPMKVKGGYTDENGVYQPDYLNETFNVKIELKKPGQSDFEVYQERTLGIEFHTEVKTSIRKDQSTATLKWDESKWGPKPADADEYFYVIWNLKSTNTDSTQPYQLCWSEDTVHDGSVVYSTGLGQWSNEYTNDSARNIQVVTKHPLKEAMAAGAWAKVYNEAVMSVKWKSGYEQQLRTSGEASAFVGETYDDGDRSLTKFIPNSGSQSAHYVAGGQDLLISGQANEKLPELTYNIVYHEKNNTDDPGWSPSGEMEITPRKYVFSDGVSGRSDVLISGVRDTDTSNKSKWDAANQYQLDDGDYYFTYLDITVNEYDSVFISQEGDKKNWANPYKNNNKNNYGNITVYVRTMGSAEFLPNKEFTRADFQDGGEDGGYKVHLDLPADTVGYKIEYTSTRYTTEFAIDTAIKLKDTQKIHSISSSNASSGMHTLIKNKAQVDITTDAGKMYMEESKRWNAWYSAYELNLSETELWAKKDCLDYSKIKQSERAQYFETVDATSTVEFPVAITGYTYSKNQTGAIKKVKSGTFHDLLPYGFVVDKSKIVVCGRTAEHCQAFGKIPINSQKSNAYANSYKVGYTADNFVSVISSEYYSVRFIDDWEGSGQTMMIISIGCPDDMVATGFTVYYKCKTTINNLHINGTTPKNYVAFTDNTANQALPDSRKESKLEDSTIKRLFAPVDTQQTAYAYGTTNIEAPNAYQYGADSNVNTEGADIARSQVVGLNTEYNYEISYEGSTTTKTENLVFYDVIERQTNKESQWYGTFDSVDVEEIKKHKSLNTEDGTCAPVVYYVSSDDISKAEFTSEMYDLDYVHNGKKLWSTTMPDKEKVVAIAVDCRKTTSGADFILGPKQGLDFRIYMKSPPSERETDLVTYNEAIIKAQNRDLVKPINLYARTNVTLRFANPDFVKSAFPASGTEEKPGTVVYNTILNYTLTIHNPDPEVPMYDVILEDVLPADLVPVNDYRVSFNEGTPISIDSTERINYSLTNQYENDVLVARKFNATIDVVDSDETIAVTVPVKVLKSKDSGTFTNEAKVTSINGVPYENLPSNKTYHKVTGVKAKILKVNSKDEPLKDAKLEIYLDNDGNFNPDGTLKPDAVPIDLVDETTGDSVLPKFFLSKEEVSYFDIEPGKYVLHECTGTGDVPEGYNHADDIRFTVDRDGYIRVGGEMVDYVKMVDEPPYKVIFRENKPEGTEAEKNKIFRIYESLDLTEDKKITAFDEIPHFANDEYVFAGWYHDADYTQPVDPDSLSSKMDFDDTYVTNEDGKVYNLYAKWVKYKVVFHENKPEGTYTEKNERQKIFATYKPSQLVDNKVPAFDDIPNCGGEEYEFDGWYHDENYSEPADPDTLANIESSFTDEYPLRDGDYHLYAKWTKIAPADYKVIFHENRPEGTYTDPNDKQKDFKTVESADLPESKKIAHFYDIPAWASDEYVFKGWYHNSGYTETDTPDDSSNAASFANTAANFEKDTYPERDSDYHLYAKWIKVGTLQKAGQDVNNYHSTLRGFGLTGVQVRKQNQKDSNFGNAVTPPGMRFVTSLSESLINEINSIPALDGGTKELLEYGYAVTTEANIEAYFNYYYTKNGLERPSDYKLQYKGGNVNGVDTTVAGIAEHDYRIVTNEVCTSRHGNENGVVQDDHRNFDNYRLYTLVITYETEASQAKIGNNIVARSYLRYYDANGKLRVFYNNYDGDRTYGGCMCNYQSLINP